ARDGRLVLWRDNQHAARRVVGENPRRTSVAHKPDRSAPLYAGSVIKIRNNRPFRNDGLDRKDADANHAILSRGGRFARRNGHSLDLSGGATRALSLRRIAALA